MKTLILKNDIRSFYQDVRTFPKDIKQAFYKLDRLVGEKKGCLTSPQPRWIPSVFN